MPLSTLPEDPAHVLHAILAALPGNFILLQPDAPTYTIVAMSADLLRQTGREPAQVVGHSVFVAYPENPEEVANTGPTQMRTALDASLRDQQVHELPLVRYDVPAADGTFEERYWSGRSQAVLDAQGAVLYLLFTSVDRTAQQRAANERRAMQQAAESEARFRTLVEQAPVAMCLTRGPEVVIEAINEPMLRMMHQPTAAAVLGRRMVEVLPEIESQTILRRAQEVIETGQVFRGSEIPVTLRRNDELQVHFFNVSYTPFIEQGQVTGTIHVAVDVTEQVQARRQAEALQAQVLATAQRQVQEREMFYRIFEQTPAAICIQRGPEHRYEYANAAYQAFFPGRQLLGQTVAEALPETVDSGVVALLDRVYQTGETYYGEELPLLIAQPEGPPQQMYFTFTYQALRENDQIVGISTFAYNVAEQVLARQQREAERQQLHGLFMQAPAPICILDGPDLVYQLVNPAYQRIFPGRELLGKPVLEALPELVNSPVPALLQAVYETGETYVAQEMQLMMARSEGEALVELFCTFTYQARRNTQGAVDGMLVFVYDITEQVRARRLVEENEQQVRALVENAPFLMGVYVGPELRFQLANQAMLNGLGKGPDVLGKRYADVLPELKNSVVIEQMHQVLATGQPLHLRDQRLEVLMHGTPQTFYYNYSFIPLRDAQGQVYGLLNTAVDVTDLVQARQRIESYAAELQESEARFRTMADAAPNLVWALNPDTSVRYVNHTFLQFLGISLPQFVAENWVPYLHPDDVEATQQAFVTAIAAGTLFRMEHRLRRHDGQYRWLLSQGAPSYLAGGELYGYVGSAIDITELKQANEQLRRTNVDLDNFIYTASHDLKAPIANIEGLLSAVEHELPAAGRVGQVPTMLHLMQQAVERFGRTIAHLTDISRLQQEHDQAPSPVSLARVVQEVELDLAPLITQSQARVTVDVPVDVRINFSEKNLRSVVYNLMSNALKYRHPDRAPEVRVTYARRAAGQVLEVRDNGLGLDLAQDQEKLFGMFKRLHSHVEGTGVGLYMVKKIIENAGGRIEVDSVLDQGSTFRIHFPS
ncbi:PAS domain-containing protein [Hymenobacter chitinivorans]|uniref:histidine kinase n=1 Tax=Hymenobacter chitinivorans DSM 11115 TaxID=1121954 RepID=A0A2M9BSQ2_9BACT|nr:PAS domain-containing protein [Hymenobacter chitinivorans]PJJ60967.1 PAS domain S-box-containing protein [Hymenobacter chitinivorans DSM 11115]